MLEIVSFQFPTLWERPAGRPAGARLDAAAAAAAVVEPAPELAAAHGDER
jgi:hypothetical protein